MTTLPAAFTINENEMIEFASQKLAVVQQQMSASYSRKWLEAMACDCLQEGLIETLKLIEAADDGDEIADAALRRVYAEMSDRGEEPPATLKAYGIRAVLHGPVRRGRGAHTWFDHWRRDIGIAVLVFLVSEHFGLSSTRNREQRRAGQLSGSSVVSAAFGRRRTNISEKTIENIWGRLRRPVIAFVINNIAGR